VIRIEPIVKPEDFTISLVYEIFKEVGDRFPPEHGSMNITYMVNEWKRLLDSGLAMTWMALKDQKPVGVLGALFMRDIYTGKLMAFEHFWFVLEAERQGNAGLKLFREFEKAAKSKGCETMWMGFNHINSPKGLKKFYERKGFLEWGATFRKVIKHG
jgi:GNAT superfamily N-acetyltransferase